MMTKGKAGTKKAIGYIRVSTDDQAENGTSLQLQREKLEALATLQDLDLVDVVEDAGASAKNLRRPGMERVLAAVDTRNVEVVVVFKLDRLTRSVRDLGDLLDRFDRSDVSLVSVSESLDTGTAAGRLVLNVMASVAQWERETVGERTREALQAKQARGEKTGGNVPFGYRLAEDGLHLEEDPEEQATIRELCEMRENGWSWQRIADELNARDLRTKTGRAWTWKTARKIGLREAA